MGATPVGRTGRPILVECQEGRRGQHGLRQQRSSSIARKHRCPLCERSVSFCLVRLISPYTVSVGKSCCHYTNTSHVSAYP
jgi:hypothetical protein